MTKRIKYANADKHLYPNYLQYCHDNGIKPLCRHRFIEELLETCKELGGNVYVEETQDGLVFVNLRLKTQAEIERERKKEKRGDK
jgi:phage/plasmid-associated DNA primase